MNKFRGVLFDVDGTLYHQGPLRLFMVCRLLAAHVCCPHRLPSTLRIIRAYRRAQEELRSTSQPLQDCGNEQIFRAVSGTGESRDRVAAVVREWFEEKPLFFCLGAVGEE